MVSTDSKVSSPKKKNGQSTKKLPQADRIEGILKYEYGDIILLANEQTIYPVPYPIQTAISFDAMKAYAASVYKEFVGHNVTMSGNISGDILYDARVIRSYEPRDPSKYSEDYWNDRIPKADIVFKARKLPGYNLQFTVDVRQMITINDSVIYDDLKDHNLLVADPANCDDDIFRIYHHSRVKDINPYFYSYDSETFGCEFFMYPYELRQLKKGDCDDWGIELASYLIMAGVPEWRVRCVVGSTYDGGGHLTVYVLNDKLDTWHHINSTTPWWNVVKKGYQTLSDFPKAGDSNDKIGIEDVWFSFNNKYAWHAFETHASEDNFRKVPWANNFKITPIF